MNRLLWFAAGAVTGIVLWGLLPVPEAPTIDVPDPDDDIDWTNPVLVEQLLRLSRQVSSG